ncbi:PREDICTED: centrosomal protein of 135 kDa isoform X3 [Dinoponera quadriceps]|uniref:Centrosomal protein of 135 kDa isoform X3 n=1 Tax=Dinoponera quadriceps TaxID=609295 RepID=A0A6P3XCF8_DINQU|nr:PREDICTED: centrosomal protein of 135 kDa isoform X3 [Dinoponera quadriceps]
MSGEAEYNVAARYRTVRKHLDNLGYKQALSLDALPLIETLLADLIQTTDSLKHFKSIAQENVEACSQLQLAIDPYKCDNARLVRECNQLHADLIEAKETHQKQVKELKKQIHKLECECNDLQLASSRNIHKIKELESESAAKSKKILELQGKCLKPTITNAGLAAKKRPSFPLRRPVLESEPMPRAKSGSALPRLSSMEPKVIDMISMADHKIGSLSHEVTKLRGELLLQTDTVQTLEKQLTTKEKEMNRLRKMLEGGRSYAAVSKDCVCKKLEKKAGATHDVMEVNEMRILQQTKLELEQQLKEALNKQHDAMSQAMKLAARNEELEKELRDIDHVALAVEADCNSAVKENNRRVCRLQEKLEDVMTQVHVLERELTVERREVQELRADLEACRLEKRNIQRTLESTLDEKKQMTDRINQLTIIEKNLNDEIGRLTRENESRTQASKNHLGEKYGVDHQTMAKDVEITKDATNLDMQRRIDEANLQIASLQQSIQRLEAERDHYRKEYINCREEQRRVSEKDNVELWTRICELKRELGNKEQALSEAQRQQEELYHEKEDLEVRLRTYKGQQRQACVPCRSCSLCKPVRICTCSTGPSIATGDISTTKTMFERLERERDTARADVERLIEERDALRERLKMMAETNTSEQLRLKESLVEAEKRLKHAEKERQDLLVTQGTRRAAINGLEDQLDDVQEELRRTKQELVTQRTQYFQLRTLQDQTDQALGDAQGQLSQAESELNKAIDRNRSMEQQQTHLNDQIKELKQEINALRSSMTLLDQEKDRLLMALDEKTEKIAALERELVHKDQQTEGMQQQVRDLQHKNEICVDQSAEQERQLRSLQLEMETIQRQFEAASMDRENAIQENRKLQDDLAAVTCEVRNMQRELEASRAEAYDLKRQLQTYVSEVRRAEELLNRKENERTEMLNHFRSLSLEATVLETNNHSLESEAAEARGALQTARHQMLDLERQLTDRDCLIKGYETQISNLTQSVANMETQLRQQTEQKLRAESDLMAIRDLCVKLDQQKDALLEQLGDKDSTKAHYEAQLSRLKAEQSVAEDQMTRDRVTVERLETLLDQARQESINAQTTNQELQNEIARLKQRISELQSKLSSESMELRRYQTQAAEYNKQISELRRQVTNERFDRARKEEESRRCLQRSCVRSDVSGTDVDTARRTNRFDAASDAGVCACTERGRAFADAADVRRINIIIRPELTVTGVADESSGREDETPPGNEQRNGAEVAGYFEEASHGLIGVPWNTNFGTGEEDSKNLLTSDPLRAKKIEIFEETGEIAEIMQDQSVGTEFTEDVSPEARPKTLLELLRDDHARPRRCFCSKRRVIPRGTGRIIAVNTMRRIPVCRRPNVYACRKINGRSIARYRGTNDVETDDFCDISKDEASSLNMYSDSSDYEMSLAEKRRNDRVVRTISRSYVEKGSSRRRDATESNSNARDVREDWTYVKYLIDDTLGSLEGANVSAEERRRIGEREENCDGARRFCQRNSRILRGSNFHRS